MNRGIVIKGILAAIIFQFSVLLIQYINSVYPLWTGKEVRLKTIPVDPRSLFRGNYARLRYDIGQLAKSEINAGYQPRQNEIVYINLDENTEGIHEFAGASLIKPAQGLFIKGRIQRHGGNDYRVKYGIEAYFAPLDKAYELERELQDGGIATVMIAQNGKAALQSIDASE